jgi:integrase
MRLELVTRNAAKYVDMPRIERHKITPLTSEQARALLVAVAGDSLEAAYHIALHLGCRRGEIMGLKWCHIDFSAGTLEVSGALQRVNGKLIRVPTKTNNVRILPLPEALARVLKAHKERQQARMHDSEYVFTTTVNTPVEPCNISSGFKNVLKRAGLPSTIRFHDLRHTCATFLINEGVHLRVVMEILGHSTITTTADIYSHVLPKTTRDAVNNYSFAKLNYQRPCSTIVYAIGVT